MARPRAPCGVGSQHVERGAAALVADAPEDAVRFQGGYRPAHSIDRGPNFGGDLRVSRIPAAGLVGPVLYALPDDAHREGVVRSQGVNDAGDHGRALRESEGGKISGSESDSVWRDGEVRYA